MCLCMLTCAYATHIQEPLDARGGYQTRLTGARVIGSCEPLNMGTWMQTQIFWKKKHGGSFLLSYDYTLTITAFRKLHCKITVIQDYDLQGFSV